MPVNKADYEELLANYSNRDQAIALLKQYRPYLEMIPSMRRPDESVITIPLPMVRLRNSTLSSSSSTSVIPAARETISLPCDVVILMCDPEWKIKMGVEIFIFIHRPDEDFSDLLSRWRRTQVLLDKDYEWLMPSHYQHILSEGTENIYPLFAIFAETPDRIKRGLLGARLPFITQKGISQAEEEKSAVFSPESPLA